MLSAANERTPMQGLALLQLGFRPFFLAAAGFAVLVMVGWFGLFIPGWPLPFYSRVPVLTHAHEMVFGYAAAVIAGFLLTAIRNWTQIPTARGWHLAGLLVLWGGARILALPGIEAPWSVIALLDCLFLAALCVAITLPLVQSRQWPQLAVVSKLVLILAANVLFYVALMNERLDLAWWGIYCGLYLVLSLVLMFSRRVMPAFIQNGVDYPVTLRNSRVVDIALLVLFVVFAVTDVFFDAATLVSVLAGLLFVLHAWRLAGWYTHGALRKPLLWILYGAYAAIIVGFALKALVPLTGLSPSLAVHAFTYGGIGAMTLGMMSRVSLGHTGRNVFEPPSILGWMFLSLLLGASVRVFLPWLAPAHYFIWVGASQVLWMIAFTLFLVTYAPMLVRARIDGRPG